MSLADLPAGDDVIILHRTNDLQLECEAHRQALREHGEDTPTNKICSRAPRVAQNRIVLR